MRTSVSAVTRRGLYHGGADGSAVAQGLDAKPDKVGRAHILEHAEPQNGLGDNGGYAQHGGGGVHADAKGHATGRSLPLRAAVEQRYLGDEGKVRPWQHHQYGRHGYEEQQVFQ